MKSRKRIHIAQSIIALLIFSAADPITLAYENKDVADLLGWIDDPYANLCHGYYSEPQSLLETKVPPPFAKAPTRITYTGPGVLYRYGESTVSQNVILTQPGRIARADKAIIYRDPKNGKIDYIRLEGHTQVEESGKLVAGPYSVIHFDEHTLESGPAAYHFFEDPKTVKLTSITRAYDAWGTADKTFRDASGLVHLSNATYTTCSPVDPAWQISASKIVLDKKEGFGTAYNMKLQFYSFPLLYAPVYSFPIDNRRKSGFLTPVPSYQKNNGFQLALPYYWNLAPNYDLTTTPKYIENRGLQFNSLFRYLESPHNNGQIYLSVVPDDPKFGQFREDTLANPPKPPPGKSLTPYLDELSGDSTFRGFIRIDENVRPDPNLSGHLHLNYVTDDYFFQDFGTAYSDVSANQLLNQGDVEYQTKHWSFTGLLQGYQTLHLIGQAGNPAVDQYSRLPELDFNSDYADFLGGADFSLGAQSVNFSYYSLFKPTTLQMPAGERLHLRPSISRPFNGSAWYVTPQISLDTTVYAAQLPAAKNEDTRQDFDAARNLPIADIDSGLYLDRPIHWSENHDYLATLEPRLFYLYVPYMDQNRYPNFDSAILPFTFPQLFDVNRFTSYDRLQNANQFSFGLTSRVLNSNTLAQNFKMDFGFGYYLEPPKVCLNPSNCNNSTFQYISPNSHLTPLVGQVTYSPWTDWSTTSSYAYDPSIGATNNASIGINFNHRQLYIFNMKYTYVRDQNGNEHRLIRVEQNTNLISSGFALPLSQHWSGLAYGQYNISKKRPDSYYVGLQYDTCCWTIRAIASRSYEQTYTSSADGPVNVFKDSYYVQLQLKSLGSIGTSPGNLLASTLGGFDDTFR